MRDRVRSIGLVSALFLACGCDDRERKVVRVQPDREHYCSVDCHHHYYDSQRTTYVKVDKHRHGPGCGHRWDGRHWVAVRKVERAPRGHQCTVDCRDHHYDGDRVVKQTRHRHGRDCGHVYDGHRWVRAPQRQPRD